MDIFNSDTYFYISCMNKEVFDAFKLRYGKRILELSNKQYNLMIDAVADLYLMSKAKEMILSFGSTFGELSWWLGGGEGKVNVVGDYEKSFKCWKY